MSSFVLAPQLPEREHRAGADAGQPGGRGLDRSSLLRRDRQLDQLRHKTPAHDKRNRVRLTLVIRVLIGRVTGGVPAHGTRHGRPSRNGREEDQVPREIGA